MQENKQHKKPEVQYFISSVLSNQIVYGITKKLHNKKGNINNSDSNKEGKQSL